MKFFYNFLIIYIFLTSFYFYSKNFKNFDHFVSTIFKLLLNYLGYKVVPFNLYKLPSKIIIIGSHTSIYDFIIGTIFYYAYLHERYSTYVLMKKNFEKIVRPFLYFFSSKFKLISVDKSNSKKNGLGITKSITDSLKDETNYVIFIAPEGTRRCVENIRTGYWIISKNLNASIAYLGIDFSSKDIIFENPRLPFESFDDEKEEFIKSCKKYVPIYPERCFWTKDFYE
jgi:1-acyl-sn-glycerol-3-phosphate acyltransferase